MKRKKRLKACFKVVLNLTLAFLELMIKSRKKVLGVIKGSLKAKVKYS